jgi:hypothetical protein
MFKKFKILAILSIVFIYIFGVIFTFSGDLISHIQLVRHENQIKKLDLIELLEFTNQEWLPFSDNKEIKYKNNFYDVISVQIIQSKVLVKVVKDNLESKLRLSFLKVFNKNKFPNSDYKKFDFFSKHITISTCTKLIIKTKFLLDIKQNFNIFFQHKTRSYINLLQKPPCYN